MATSRDVAKLAGVSVATVSRVFTDSVTVTDITANRVMEAAKELGYMPNCVARSLKSSRSRTVGLVIPNIFNPVFYQVAAVITTELEKFDYKVILSFNSAYERSPYKNLQTLLSAQVEAIAFTPLFEDANVQELLNQTNVYTIQILGDVYKQIDSVKYDDYGSTCRISQYLIDKGHRRIMLICPAEDRKEGLYATLKKNAIQTFEGNYISPLPLENSASIIEDAINTYKPTAIIGVTQEVLTTLMITLKKLQYHIPDAISVIAYDENPLSQYENITTVGHEIHEIGTKISKMILERLTQNNEPNPEIQHMLLDTVFIERSSVREIEQDITLI